MAWVRANFEYKEANNDWVRICNPMQEKETGYADTKFHLNINIKTGVVHDWRPNWQHHDGHITKFLQNYLGCSFKEAISTIKNAKVSSRDEFLDEEDVGPSSQEIKHLELPEHSWMIGSGPEKIQRIALNYLKSRKISEQEAIKWGLRYGIDKIIFPYIEYDEVVYWQSREIMNKRFEFPDANIGVTKSQFFYGWHMIDPGDSIYIVESLFEVINIGPGGLGSGGASLSEAQCNKLRVMSPEKIILCPDNDEAGEASLASNYNKLTEYHGILWYCIPPKEDGIKDWNDLAKTGIDVRQYINNNIKKLNLSVVMKIKSNIKRNRNNLRKILDEEN